MPKVYKIWRSPDGKVLDINVKDDEVLIWEVVKVSKEL